MYHCVPCVFQAYCMSISRHNLVSFHRCEQEEVFDVLRWLDRILIRIAGKFGDFQKDNPASFQWPTSFAFLPHFLFHMRRSQFLQVTLVLGMQIVSQMMPKKGEGVGIKGGYRQPTGLLFLASFTIAQRSIPCFAQSQQQQTTVQLYLLQ